jgi:hypothetical protein
MPNLTTHYSIPYPLGTEAADGPSNMGALATTVDNVLWANVGAAGTFSAAAVTLTNSNFTLQGAWAYKVGRSVTFQVNFTSKNALGPGAGDGNIADIVVGVVAAGFRPIAVSYFPVGWGRNFLSCSVATNGDFAINSLLVPSGSIAAGQAFLGNTAFVLQ